MADLRKIVQQHGGELRAGGREASIPAPGHSKADRSLSLKLSDDGERVVFHSFTGGDVRSIMDYLGIEAKARPQTPAERERYLRLRDHERKVRAAAERREAEADRAFCQRVWAATLPAEASPVEAYLWSRGLIYDGPDIRFHPRCPRSKEDEPAPTVAPAMVALVRALDGSPQALHTTSILADGSGKAFGHRSRLMFGPMRGHALQLSAIGPERVLAVGEGIETCGAYSTLKGVPAWSCLSTSGLQNFIIPPRLSKLIIAADGDKGGMIAAQALAERACKVCDVVIDPAPNGKDWNDVLGAGHV